MTSKEYYHKKKQDATWWENHKQMKKTWLKKNYQSVLDYRKKLFKEKRQKAFEHYSKGKPKCACCGEEQYLFLTLDHINGGGRKERKKLGSHLYFFYTLEKRNYPPEYQVLCYNCNCVKKVSGTCPHKLLSLDEK